MPFFELILTRAYHNLIDVKQLVQLEKQNFNHIFHFLSYD